MNPELERIQFHTRRHFLRHSTAGIGGIALNALMANDLARGASPATLNDPLDLKQSHFAAKAKRVIYMHMTVSPPNLDLFDYKP